MRFLFTPKRLPDKFPTKLETLQAFLFEKKKWMANNCRKKEPAASVIAGIVTEQIQKVYLRAGIKILQTDRIKAKVVATYKSRLDLLKIPRSKRYILSKKVEEFKSSLSKTLDVTCNNYTSEDNSKSDQHQSLNPDPGYQSELSSDDSSSNESDEDYEISSSEPPSPKRFNKLDLSEVVDAKTRFKASERGTTAIVNATLRMVGVSTIVDKSKLVRAQKRRFNEIENIEFPFGGGLYYDGRKDLTLTRIEKRDGKTGKMKYYRKMTREDHYSLISEPGGLFLGYVTVDKGKAKMKSQILISFLERRNMLKDLMALGSDGENNNVGTADGGINQHIEAIIKRPVHWFVCLLHANELPLKNLICKLDGPTTSAKTLSGPIGKKIMNIANANIVRYQKFDGAALLTLPDQVYKKLSNDQKYLFRIVNALISGKFPESLQRLKVGPYNQSRWLTAGSRICLLYASTEKPSPTLHVLTSYIVNVYAPTWFQIKKHELAVNGPENLFYLIQKIKLVRDANARAVVTKCIRRNAFFAHSENVLLAQLASSNKIHRYTAVHKILSIRKKPVNGAVRRFKVPEINFEAKHWTDMRITNADDTEPPFTLSMSEDELKRIIHDPLDVPKYKCHTQMVERAVKEVTRVSANVVDQGQRSSMIKATLVHRAKYPKLDSLKDHFTNQHEFLPKI